MRFRIARRRMARQAKLVGTRSCAIRHRTSEEGEHLVKQANEKEPEAQSACASEKRQKQAWRNAAQFHV